MSKFESICYSIIFLFFTLSNVMVLCDDILLISFFNQSTLDCCLLVMKKEWMGIIIVILGSFGLFYSIFCFLIGKKKGLL